MSVKSDNVGYIVADPYLKPMLTAGTNLPPMRYRPFFTLLICTLLTLLSVAQAQEAAMPFSGDLGAGIHRDELNGHRTEAFPYAEFEYGPFFSRVDTFGISTAPVAWGNLDLVTRVLQEGSPAQAHLQARHSSIPVGLGTLQITPLGAVMLNMFHDLNKSGGNLIDGLVAEEFSLSNITFYPQLGVEWRSRAYVNYFYGISAIEALNSTIPVYQAQASSNYFTDLLTSVQVGGNWYLNLNLRQTWLDLPMANSPLIRRHSVNSGLLALCYRW